MKKLLGMALLLLGLVVAICVYQQLNFGKVVFFNPGNMSNLAQRIGVLGIYALGAGIVILSGGIDLSVGSVVGFVGIMMAMLVRSNGSNAWPICGLVIVFCVALGFWHGFLINRFKLQPFVVTLCSLLLLRGLARGISGGVSVKLGNFSGLGNGSLLGIPASFWLLIGIALIVGFLMNFTVYGRYLYAIGRNAEAVRYSGIKVSRITTLSYVICSVLAGIAGIISVSYTGEVQPASAGMMFELWAVAAAVLGGCSLRGGEGSVIGVIIGAALIKVMYNGINLIGISTEWEWAVIGIVILGGVIADAAYKLRAAKKVKA